MGVNNRIAAVFGGTGFAGRQVVRELAKAGITVKVATRVPEGAYFLRPCGTVGQVVPVACDYKDENSIARVIAGSDYVVNCVGILSEKKKGDFQRVHATLPGTIAKLCQTTKVKRLVHISALGVDKASSKYAQSKVAGESAVLQNFPNATILRPSVIFGENDHFFNMFATIARLAPMLPLIGGGKTKLQPVYVGDVADAVMAVLARDDAKGQIYELGGAEVLNFRQIYERMFSYTQNPRRLVSFSWGLSKMMASFAGLMPGPALITGDQVQTLKTDNIVSPGAKGLGDLGVKQTAMDMILPRYLERYRKGGRFADVKAAQ